MPLTHALSDRRSLIATLALLPLAACATPMGRYTVEQAVRRLLQLSSERAFARLTEPGGFYDDQLTRITPPDLGGGTGGAVLSALLRTDAVRSRVAMALNDVAVDLADNAAPIVMDAVQRMTLSDAVSVLRGGPLRRATCSPAKRADRWWTRCFPAHRARCDRTCSKCSRPPCPRAAGATMPRLPTMFRTRSATPFSARSGGKKRKSAAIPARPAIRC